MSRMRVAALYRHPVKSFPAEPCDYLQIAIDGRVVGDRVLGFRFDDAGPPQDTEWRQKTWFASLQHSPALASLRCGYDVSTRRIWIQIPSQDMVIEGSIDEPGDRLRIEYLFNQWYESLDDTPAALGRRKLPLRLVGNGTDGRFHDTSAGLTTLHSRESLNDLAKATGISEISELRFRSNIAIEGCDAWDELAWIGKRYPHWRSRVPSPQNGYPLPRYPRRPIHRRTRHRYHGHLDPHHRPRSTAVRRINSRQKPRNDPHWRRSGSYLTLRLAQSAMVEMRPEVRIRHNIVLRVHHDILLQLDRHPTVNRQNHPGDERGIWRA